MQTTHLKSCYCKHCCTMTYKDFKYDYYMTVVYNLLSEWGCPSLSQIVITNIKYAVKLLGRKLRAK